MSDGDKMVQQAKSGDKLAAACLSLYDLHLKAVQDPGARGLFRSAYEEWKQRESSKH